MPGAQDTAGHSAAPPAAGGGARGSPPDGCGLLSLHFGRRFPDDTCCGVISVGVSLTTRAVGCVSMSGFAVLVSSPGRRLFRSSARFFIRSFALSLLSFKSPLYILEKSPVSDVSLANILS